MSPSAPPAEPITVVRGRVRCPEQGDRRTAARCSRTCSSSTRPTAPGLAALGVIANAEPLWAQLDDVMEALTVPRLGEPRASAQYPWATLRDPFALTDPGALAKVRVARTWLRGRSLSG